MWRNLGLADDVMVYSVEAAQLGRNCHYSPFGRPYVSITCGGIKAEGEPMTGWQETEEDAVEVFKATLKEHVGDRKFVVFRRVPVIEQNENGFNVYARYDAN